MFCLGLYFAFCALAILWVGGAGKASKNADKAAQRVRVRKDR